MTGSIGQNVTISDSGFTLTLNGNTINGTAGLGVLIDNANAYTLTITAPVKLGGAQIWRNNSGNLFTVGAGGINLNNKAFTSDGAGNTAVTGVMSGAGAFTKDGSGTLTLSGANTYTGTTTVSAGTLIIKNTSTSSAVGLIGGGAVSVSSGATLAFNNADTVNDGYLIGAISGAGVVSFVGPDGAVTTLNTANTYSGGTTISSGIVNLNSNTALGTGTVTMTGGALRATGGARTLANNFTLSGVIGVGMSTNISGTITLAGNTTITPSINSGSTTWGAIALGAYTLATGDTGPNTSGGSWTGQSLQVTGIISGTGGVTQGSVGSLTLSAANTFSGNTKITAGTLVLGNNLALQNSTLDTSGAGVMTATGYTTPTLGGLIGSTNLAAVIATGYSAVTALTLNPGSGVTNTYSGIIANGAAGMTLAKTGLGSQALSGANSYTGATTVSAGILNIQNATGLGTTAAGTTVSSGATLQLQGGITVGAETLNINGAGASGQTGALVNVSSTNNYGGLLTLAGATTISSDSGTLNLTNTGTITGATYGLTLAGAGNGTVSSIIGTTSGTLTKNGAGTWTLAGANTYTGATTVNAGQLIATLNTTQNATGTGAVSIASGATLKLDNNNATSSGFTINNIFSGAGTLNLNLSDTNTAFTNLSNLSGLTGNLHVSAVGANADKLVFNAAVTMPGSVTIDSGTTLFVYTGTSTVSGGISVSGAGNTEGYGAIRIDSGSVLAGNITLLGNTTFGTFAGSGGTFSGNISSGVAGNVTLTELTYGAGHGLTFSGVLSDGSGTLALTTTQGGTTILSGANTYTGATTVSAGTLKAGSTSAFGNNSATTVTGTLDLAGFSNSLGSLAGAGTVTSSSAGGVTLTTGGASTNTTFSGTLQDGSGTVGLSKSGTGTQILSGANTYTGTTTVSAGVLNIQNATALGTTAAGTAVTAGAALQIQGNIAVGAEALTLNGSGIASDGALRNISGNNSWAGAITLGSASTIASDAGTLTHSGTLTNGGFLVTYSGAGNITASGVISGTGGLTKTGAGTLTLNGASANTFTGNTTVSGGTLAANADAALSATTKVTINTGGTVLFGSTASNNRISNTAELALAGGTLNTGGFSETVGKMTLTVDSTFDFGAGTSRVTFDGLSSFGSSTLTIYNWTGTKNTIGGTDQLLFSNSSFTAGSTTSQVQFNIGGTLYNSVFLSAGASTFELVPVPEPSTIFGASALVLAIGWRERKRIARVLRTLSRA